MQQQIFHLGKILTGLKNQTCCLWYEFSLQFFTFVSTGCTLEMCSGERNFIKCLVGGEVGSECYLFTSTPLIFIPLKLVSIISPGSGGVVKIQLIFLPLSILVPSVAIIVLYPPALLLETST